jgi:hypothetical protein
MRLGGTDAEAEGAVVGAGEADDLAVEEGEAAAGQRVIDGDAQGPGQHRRPGALDAPGDLEPGIEAEVGASAGPMAPS